MSINILVGNEIYFKNLSIDRCLNSIDAEKDILKLDIDDQKNITNHLMDMNSHLLSYDFFGNTKVGILRTHTLSKAIDSIKYFMESDLGDSLLIIDLFTKTDKQISDFKKKDVVKKLPKSINLEYHTTLKTYEEDKLFPFVKEQLDIFDIKFASDKDYDKSVEYIVKNSNLSYSCAYNEIKKLTYLNNKRFTYEKIVDAISDNLCTDRYYILDRLFEASEIHDVLKTLTTYLPKFKRKDLEAMLMDISNLVKDYIVFKSTGTCMQKSNYYKFKKLKFDIINANEFLVNINKLLKDARKGNPAVGDYLFLYIFEHFQFN